MIFPDFELIAQVDLIHMTSISGDWAEWYRIIGAAPPANVRGGLRVDTVNMALEAARRGHGIALGRTPLFEAEIASGELVCLLDERVPSGWSYWLVTMDADFRSQDVKGFRQWLLDEVGAAASPASKQRPRDRLRQARASIAHPHRCARRSYDGGGRGRINRSQSRLRAGRHDVGG